MSTWVFPGLFGSGRTRNANLLDKMPQLVSRAEDLLGFPLAQYWLEPQRQGSEPATIGSLAFMENVLLYYDRMERSGGDADYLIGIGLGEIGALCCAGAICLEDGLKLVQAVAKGMAHCQRGGTLSVVGLGRSRIREVLSENELGNLQLAGNLNPRIHLISGPFRDLQMAKAFFEMDDLAEVHFLEQYYGFYSSLMLPAETALERSLCGLRFAAGSIPVISTAAAQPFSPENMASLLGKQFSQPLDWELSITYLRSQSQEGLVCLGEAPVLSRLLTPTDLVGKKRDPARLKSKKQVLPKQNKGFTTKISAESLGSAEFKRDYGIRYAYLAGAMYKGIASKELVVRMGKAGLMGYYGAGGIALDRIDETIGYIQTHLLPHQAYGMNLLCNPASPETEEQTVDLYLHRGVRYVEAASYLSLTPALVRYRLTGLRRIEGRVIPRNHVLAKVSRPEVATQFMQPAPPEMLKYLVAQGGITAEDADLAAEIPLAADICVESDSAGHTDQGIALVLLPSMCRLKDRMMETYRYSKPIRVGAAGGIGSPEAAAAMFMLGADFVLTGSINQCTVEAGISDSAKDMLQNISIQDTAYAPAPDFFEVGGKGAGCRQRLVFFRPSK